MKGEYEMTGREIIKNIMNLNGITNAQMAHRLSISQAAVWDRLNNKKLKDIPFSLLCEMLSVIDYDVLIVPHGKGSKIEGAYAVSGIEDKLT